MSTHRKRLGDLLIEAKIITEKQLEKALNLQRTTSKKLGELLIDEGFVKEKQIIEVLEFQLGIPHIDLEKYFIDSEIPRLITEKIAKRHILIPIKKEHRKLTVAMSDPLNIFAIDDVKIATGLDIDVAISTKQQILNAIDKYYGRESTEKAIEDFKKEFQIENIKDIENQMTDDIHNAPTVRLVNSIIKQAVKSKASDIHIEPLEKKLRIRFRIDGELQEIMSIAKTTQASIISRIKILGKMDIAEKRIPQDGRIEIVVDGKEIDIRISILPTVHGEKVVLRLLDRNNFVLSKNELGFTEENLNSFDKIIKNPYGVILVTGPTGSGKTTTLYAILKELNEINRNIITIEDPVEYRLDGISQVQVNNKAKLTFSSGLRSILRQDPDVIMIGEIRDAETAHIAVRAAITGHLVLSTMHTNDTASTVTRLVDMDIEPYLVSSSVVGVIAQRLIKKICVNCKESYIPTNTEKSLLKIDDDVSIYKGKGCSVCNHTGYKGRQAVHEIMPINETLRLLIDEKTSIDKIRKTAFDQGMVSLKESCKQLVLQGITTVDEMVRIAYNLE